MPIRFVWSLCPGIGFGILYVVATTGEVSLVKALNYKSNVVLPIFTALVLNQAWMVMVPGYITARRSARAKDERHLKLHAIGSPAARSTGTPAHHVSRQAVGPGADPTHQALAKAYAGMGVIVYLVTVSRNVAVNYLPGSVAALLMGSSIVWSILLSKIMLKRKFRLWHYAAAAAGIGAVLAVGAGAVLGWDPEDAGPSDNGSTGDRALALVGVGSGLASGFFIALMSVASSKVTSMWPRHRNLRVTEMTLVSSLLAVLLLVPTLFVFGEQKLWAAQIGAASSTKKGLLTLVGLCLAMPFNKSLVRGSKYATISHSSAFLFEFVQAAAGIAASIANIFLFGEPWSWGIGIALALMTMASSFYVAARRADEEEAAHTRDLLRLSARAGVTPFLPARNTPPPPSPSATRSFMPPHSSPTSSWQRSEGGGMARMSPRQPLLYAYPTPQPSPLPITGMSLPGITGSGALGPAEDLTSPTSSSEHEGLQIQRQRVQGRAHLSARATPNPTGNMQVILQHE